MLHLWRYYSLPASAFAFHQHGQNPRKQSCTDFSHMTTQHRCFCTETCCGTYRALFQCSQKAPRGNGMSRATRTEGKCGLHRVRTPVAFPAGNCKTSFRTEWDSVQKSSMFGFHSREPPSLETLRPPRTLLHGA